MQKAIFAAGCFWGVQYYFDQIPGIIKSLVGYTGGYVENPTYEQVCSHKTGHSEAVLLEFDENLISYKTLVRHFFRLHDPTQLNRQGPDIGDNYRSAIYYFNIDQKSTVDQVIKDIQPDYKDPIVTEVISAKPFYPAEDYHQKYTANTGRGMCHIDYQPI